MNKEEESHKIALSQNKKTAPVFIEADLKDSEGLIYTQARERDTKPVEFIAETIADSPWTPYSFISKIVFIDGHNRPKEFLSLLLTNLPPPSVI
ncbi:hypothetical protein EHO59_12075 [Leptospira semungkisensis]|uniref:Uncharacterized protein n=1 Tax=Leptospira semungkisensis TaxID=2484985 RepID=A0A4R9FS25_9LEPT|nr:hypothetical protein [Leptospira semungkisensis]TGK00677.1 hypothetical protein EHO59_12075 [Leptospira semungkisensis]